MDAKNPPATGSNRLSLQYHHGRPNTYTDEEYIRPQHAEPQRAGQANAAQSQHCSRSQSQVRRRYPLPSQRQTFQHQDMQSGSKGRNRPDRYRRDAYRSRSPRRSYHNHSSGGRRGKQRSRSPTPEHRDRFSMRRDTNGSREDLKSEAGRSRGRSRSSPRSLGISEQLHASAHTRKAGMSGEHWSDYILRETDDLIAEIMNEMSL